MCRTEGLASGPTGMEHMEMMHEMVSGKPGGFPLIGDKLPQMEVKTTQGMMKLPDSFSGKWFCALLSSRGLHPRLHNRVCGL